MRPITIKSLVKNFLLSFSYPKEPQFNEAECLISEIEEAKNKIQYAWNRFNYAAPEYVELAVLELLLAETHYSLLNKRYRLMLATFQGAISAPST